MVHAVTGTTFLDFSATMPLRALVSKLSSSLMGLLDQELPPAEQEARMDEIREAMQASLASHLQQDMRNTPLWVRLEFASSIQSLWYLRMELMTLLCVHCDETVAHAELRRITEMFRGLVADAQLRGNDKPRR